MTEHDDKWLDELISNTIDTGKPQFDAEKWKKEYSREYEILTSRSQVSASRSAWFGGPKALIVKLALAATIVLAAALLLSKLGSDEQMQQKPPRIEIAKASPAHLLTLGSLRCAYIQGGFEAVDKQFDQASEKLNSRPAVLSMEQLFASTNGT